MRERKEAETILNVISVQNILTRKSPTNLDLFCAKG